MGTMTILLRKAAERIRGENRVDSFHEFPPRGVGLTPHSPGSGRAFSCAWLAAVAALAVSACALQPGSASAPLAYVPNEGSGTISIIDPRTDTVTGEIKTGGKPRGLAFGRGKPLLYVSDQPSNSLKIVNLDSRSVEGQVPLGKSPEGVSISPDGRWVVVAVEEGNSVSFVDTASGKVVADVKVRGQTPNTPCSVLTARGST